MPNIIKSYSFPIEQLDIIKKAEEIAGKEHISFSKVIMNLLVEYVKIHGDGNPAFSLDQFIKNTEMAAVPAVFRSTEDWLKWVLQCDDEKFLQDIITRNQTILGLADKRILELRGHTVKYV